MSNSPDREKNLQSLTDATRIAASVPLTDFWKELEERMQIRDDSTKETVSPRDLKEPASVSY